ncbi:bifunctional diaminohydroxyphosphoribosylaminopyrimidine deaminase/5-amino-6-(5-phosphoribosylamino)uracil reductase RibD [Levilactobacillus bambusae]|uniref:Riboflavin biosynthesis protein RibD n=1 Tax=Levilactobacillus bambusae TaxID=2024736 RepID=A0A2V1MZD7_9LACO|nr:bifunctional diaminohydroxyphosphoribosylaminopyrimidine deaminase/5-amino-6-(5-phosphoribosylamino)uracil reductase RibD [Levilactobacillus bambusae]PWG00339.1 bifunctional diaminohydroxyphosphoribosylaminopyrimidine deaminase/5-amino-6-(5-phosphoribosylamino)uracil reductase RibD [Levilactobacillus bambusae]
MNDEAYMRLALHEAQRGRGLTYRNPLVGAVLVKDDQVLGAGHHVHFGQSHAEVDAFNQVQHPEDVKNSTLYVTLEPCCHTGKTPPCAHQIVDWGVKEVVVAQMDPNPLVKGQGISYLEAHGVTVKMGVLSTEAEQLNETYNFYYRHKRPLVTVKTAQSLDGKIALPYAARTYLTDAEANVMIDDDRAEQQAILVGSQTVLDDDPQLLVRQPLEYAPVRVILDRRGRLVPPLRLLKCDVPIWLFTTNCHVAERFSAYPQVRIFVAKRWPVAAVVQQLGQLGIQSLMVEGGAHIQNAFLAADLVDQLLIYQVFEVFGRLSLPAFTGPEDRRQKFSPRNIMQVGNALRILAGRQ